MASISIVLHDLGGGGAEKMMVRLANRLAETGDAVELVLLTSGGDNRRFVAPGVAVVELGSRRTLGAFGPLRRHLRARRPDGILSVLTHVNVVAALVCASLGCSGRLTVSERNTFSLDRLVNPALAMRLAYALAPLLYRLLPNPVVAVSQGVAADLVAHTWVRPGDVLALPNPVVTPELLESARCPPAHPWLQEKPAPVVVAMGRLAPQKGFDLLLQAFARVRAGVDCRLVIFGEGALRGELQAQAERLRLDGCVDFPGYCGQPLAEIARADLFVLSSRFEGSPNALVEAMAVGVPVLAFDCPHGPREILGGEAAAGLIPAFDIEALSRAMAERLVCPPGEAERREIRARVDGYRAEVSGERYRQQILGSR